MGCVWDVHGMYMGFPWDVHKIYIGCAWDVHRMCMEFPWDVHRIYVGCAWVQFIVTWFTWYVRDKEEMHIWDRKRTSLVPGWANETPWRRWQMTTWLENHSFILSHIWSTPAPVMAGALRKLAAWNLIRSHAKLWCDLHPKLNLLRRL